MSETVIDSGKLFPLKVTEEWAVEECARLDIEVYETAIETLSTETNQYTIIEGLGFCRVEDFKSTDVIAWQNIKANGDGSYDFSVCYYNGGGAWQEVVEMAVKEGSDEMEAASNEATSVEALKAADTALLDWLRCYAADQCATIDVMISLDRIKEHSGTLAYIAHTRELIKEALEATDIKLPEGER